MDTNLAPPPPWRFMQGLNAQPGTGIYFGLAFMIPRPQTVKLVYTQLALVSMSLSFCVEKPVVLVGNQMERSFSLNIFFKKKKLIK